MCPLGNGQCIFADCYLIRHILIEYLIFKNTYCNDTFIMNCINLPDTIKTPKIKHLESRVYQCKPGILLCTSKSVIVVLTSPTKGGSEVTHK